MESENIRFDVVHDKIVILNMKLTHYRSKDEDSNKITQYHKCVSAKEKRHTVKPGMIQSSMP